MLRVQKAANPAGLVGDGDVATRGLGNPLRQRGASKIRLAGPDSATCLQPFTYGVAQERDDGSIPRIVDRRVTGPKAD